MKLHFRSTRFPWQLWGRMASMLTKGGAVAFTDYQKGDVTRLLGVSFGMKRFIGLVVAGPFSQERVSHEGSWAIDTNDQVEVLARECGWNNRRYMTATDYSIWCERMRKFARLASASDASGGQDNGA